MRTPFANPSASCVISLASLSLSLFTLILASRVAMAYDAARQIVRTALVADGILKAFVNSQGASCPIPEECRVSAPVAHTSHDVDSRSPGSRRSAYEAHRREASWRSVVARL